MAGKRANLTVLLKLDNKRFVSGLRTARAAAGKFAAGVGRLGLRAARAAMLAFTAALAASAAAMVVGVKNALDFGGRMSDVAAQTKISVAQIQLWEEALRQGGIQSSMFVDVIGKMQKSVFDFSKGLSTQKDAFAILGISLDEIFTLNASDQLDLISKKLQGIKNDSVRVGIARDLLGRSGAKLFTVFGDGGLMAKATQTLGQQVEIFDRQAATFDRISDVIGSIGVKMRGFFAGVADNLAPMLLEIAERFDKIDLAPMGQRFGEAIANTMDNIRDLPALFGEGLILAAFGFINALRLGLAGFLAAMETGLTTGPIALVLDPKGFAQQKAAEIMGVPKEEFVAAKLSRSFEDYKSLLDQGGITEGLAEAMAAFKESFTRITEDKKPNRPKIPDDNGFELFKNPVEGIVSALKANPVFFLSNKKPVKQEEDNPVAATGREIVSSIRSYIPAGGATRRVRDDVRKTSGLDSLALLQNKSPEFKEQEKTNSRLDVLIGSLEEFNMLAREAL